MFKKSFLSFRHFLPFFLIFGGFLILEAGYFIAQNRLAERLPFGVQVADAEYSLVSANDAISELETRAQNFTLRPMLFEFDGKTVEIPPAEFDLTFEIAKKIGVLKNEIFNFSEISLPVSLNEKRLRRVLLSYFPELEFSATDARVFLNEVGELEILPERDGRQTDFAEIATAIKKNSGVLADAKVIIENDPVEPKVFAEDLESFREELAEIVKRKLVLKETEYERFEISLLDRLTWFDFDQGEVVLKKDLIEKFVSRELNPLLAKLPRDVSITRTIDGAIEFDGIAQSGRAVDSTALFEKMSRAIESGAEELEIPFRVLPAPVKVATDLANAGIQELVGEAVTNYSGSPLNRQHNIRVAAARLNGKILEPEAEFSFIDALGPVTLSNGYRQELIIKEGDIIPEVGGGVCQVSTTFFRTALNTGLPITDQRPHSMKVTYYDPPGLDATIYPGSADLKFINDTGSPILIQTAVEGTSLRVNFFGTSDGRNVKLAGPFYPDGSPVTNLKLAGLKMFWTRKVDKDGETKISETYNAAYRIMPAH
ncbi:MAG: VanW family protein [Candidatus Peribacteraceae bacterium]|nr:VanW family protein [Candidatus Peribacteraceae bacterium]